MAYTDKEALECVEVLAGEIRRILNDRDVLVVAACLLAPVVGAGDDFVSVDDAEFVMHGWLVAATGWQKDDFAAEIRQPVEIESAGALIDFVANQRQRDFYARAGFLAQDIEDIAVGKPRNGGDDFGLGLLKVVDNHLMDVGKMGFEFHGVRFFLY